jgi:hypothetical protein
MNSFHWWMLIVITLLLLLIAAVVYTAFVPAEIGTAERSAQIQLGLGAAGN